MQTVLLNSAIKQCYYIIGHDLNLALPVLRSGATDEAQLPCGHVAIARELCGAKRLRLHIGYDLDDLRRQTNLPRTDGSSGIGGNAHWQLSSAVLACSS